MTKNPACCTSDSTLQEVAHMMEMYDCGCIPVIEDHQTKRPIGTITDRDITIRTLASNKNPLEMKASDVMTTDIVTVTPETSVEDCLDTMEDKQIRRILVTDKSGKCIGIVAQADLLEDGAHPARTANFIREVSESDRSHDRRYESERPNAGRFESNRSQFNENRTLGQNNYSFSQNSSQQRPNQLHNRPVQRNYKPAEKESFISNKMLLTLLGSVGLGAAVKYYFGSEKVNRHRPFTGRSIKTYDVVKTNTTNTQSTDSLIDKPTASIRTTASATSVSAARATDDKNTVVSGSIDSLNKTKDDNDLKPITQVGKTATNT